MSATLTPPEWSRILKLLRDEHGRTQRDELEVTIDSIIYQIAGSGDDEEE